MWQNYFTNQKDGAVTDINNPTWGLKHLLSSHMSVVEMKHIPICMFLFHEIWRIIYCRTSVSESVLIISQLQFCLMLLFMLNYR